MTDNAKKFLEQISQDEALKTEFQATQSVALNELLKARGLEAEVQKAQNEALIKFAAAQGVTLTADDLKVGKVEALSDDELKAVAGGGTCACPVAGAGAGDGLACGCAFAGGGKGPRGGTKCACCGGGYGHY